MQKKFVFELERIPTKLHPETVETMRHRGGAHGKQNGKKSYNRRDKSWQKEEACTTQKSKSSWKIPAAFLICRKLFFNLKFFLIDFLQ